MAQFRIIAQAFVGSHRIVKTIRADDENAIIRIVSGELDNTGFYIASIARIG